MLLKEQALLERVLHHIDNKTTDMGDAIWREPVEHYRSDERLQRELTLVFRRTATAFCPAIALPEVGSYFARDVAQVPIIAVRGADGVVRAFRNACRHRGVQLLEGQGCKKALTCRYHAWSYGLDGRLLGIPDAHGFPGLIKDDHGLVPVRATERHGLIFVTQDGDAAPGSELDVLDDLLTTDWQIISQNEDVIEANWKLFAEGFLEGYHIRSTHQETFYPRQYNNLNVIESFGRNNRITFPYRAVERLRNMPPSQWRAMGVVTNVYHLFPNVMIATFPNTITINIIEPITPARTRSINFTLSNAMAEDDGRRLVSISRDFVNAGAAEDRAVVASEQRGLASGANQVLTFGLFEAAIGRLHQELARALA